MILAKVLGPVVSTVKNEALKGRSLFVVRPVRGDSSLAALAQNDLGGGSFLALDSVQAGPGDLVIVNREGNSCRQILENDLAPINALIVGIVDEKTL